MLVSVILPNYNHSLYLSERIMSILDQTYQKYEIIILDDCSTDNSEQIISSYQGHPKISHIEINLHNSGSPFFQWQKGFDLAKGELIWIAESDDMCDKTFLEKLTPAFTDADTVIAFSKSYIIDETSTIQSIDDWGKEDVLRWENSVTMDGIDFFRNFQVYKNCIVNASSVVFRKKSIKKITEFPIEYKRCGDWLFWNQLALMGNVFFIAEPLNYWRQHSNTTRFLGNYETEIEKFKEQINILKMSKISAQNHNIRINTWKWKWLVDRIVSRLEIKFIFKKSYLTLYLPDKLLTAYFYFSLICRLVKITVSSLKKKVVITY